MLYTKYESSWPCSFRQEDYWKLHFENLFLTAWPTYATNWNGLNNFDRGPLRDYSYEVWSKSNEWFQRRRCLSKKVYARRTTDDVLSLYSSYKKKDKQCASTFLKRMWEAIYAKKFLKKSLAKLVAKRAAHTVIDGFIETKTSGENSKRRRTL